MCESNYVCMCVHMLERECYVSMCLCMFVCMCMYICMYVCMYV